MTTERPQTVIADTIEQSLLYRIYYIIIVFIRSEHDMKDSCCFIDDYCSVITLSCTLWLVCQQLVLQRWVGLLQLNMILVTYATQQKLARMPAWFSFVNNIRF